MSTTPRTDAATVFDCDGLGDVRHERGTHVPADFARTLERENAELLAANAELTRVRSDQSAIAGELAELRAHAERVNNANDLLSLEVASLNADKARLKALLTVLRPRTLVVYRNTVDGNSMEPTRLTHEIDAAMEANK